MPWTYTSNFAQEQGIWDPSDPLGFGDLATYTLGTGFVSIDAQLDVSSFSRIDSIVTSTFPSSDLNNVTMNFDLTLADFHDGTFPCYRILVTKSDLSTVALSVDFDTAGSGAGQTLSFAVDIPNAIKVQLLVRSSNQVTAVYSGACMINSVTMDGDGDFSPLGDHLIALSGSLASVFSPNQSGTHLFFGVEDRIGNQKVTKVDRPTSTSPTSVTVYGTGGGTSANVVSTADPDRMLFFGNYGTDIGVVDHVISTVTNTDISPASIGAKLIQPLSPSFGDIDHIVAVNRDDQDALETKDGGSNWSTLNAALGQAVDAMDVEFFGAYFPFLAFIGGNDGADENLGYTPNEFTSVREDTSAALAAVGSIVSIDIAPDT